MAEATNNQGEPTSDDIAQQLNQVDNSEPSAGDGAPESKQLILDKFKDTEELQKAYQELERKQTDTASKAISDDVIEGILEKNPDMSRRQAVKAVNELLAQELSTNQAEQQEVQEPVAKTVQNPRTEKAIDYLNSKELLEKHPNAESLIPTLRRMSQHDPDFRNESYLDILEHPDNESLRNTIEEKAGNQAMTVAGSEPSAIKVAVPPEDEIKKMDSKELGELIGKLNP